MIMRNKRFFLRFLTVTVFACGQKNEFELIDRVVQMASDRKMFIGLLPAFFNSIK
jgi:hypothetical protein